MDIAGGDSCKSLTFQNDKDIETKTPWRVSRSSCARDISPDISRAKVAAQAPFLYQEGWSFFVIFLLKNVKLNSVTRVIGPITC